MQGRPSCLLQSAGAEANRILLASALSSMRIICPNKVSQRDWMIAVSLGCFVSLRTSSFRTNWYHLMPSSIRRHHWSSAGEGKFAGQRPTFQFEKKYFLISILSFTLQIFLLWPRKPFSLASRVNKTLTSIFV